MKRKNILMSLFAGAFCLTLAASCNEDHKGNTEGTESHSVTDDRTTDGTTSHMGSNETNSTGSTGKSMDSHTTSSGTASPDSMSTNSNNTGSGHTTH